MGFECLCEIYGGWRGSLLSGSYCDGIFRRVADRRGVAYRNASHRLVESGDRRRCESRVCHSGFPEKGSGYCYVFGPQYCEPHFATEFDHDLCLFL